MTRIHLIRHAHPATGWGDDPDSGLDDSGRQQAEDTARSFAYSRLRMPIYTSPLRRCRETARALEQLWQQPACVLDAVSEIPAPALDLTDRQEWLAQVIHGTWRELVERAPSGSPDYLAWRRSLLESLVGMPRESVVFTHFIAINVAVAEALSSEMVVVFRPDHASVTCIEVINGRLRLLASGREANTSILTKG